LNSINSAGEVLWYQCGYVVGSNGIHSRRSRTPIGNWFSCFGQDWNSGVEMTAMASSLVPRKRILCVDDHEDTRDMMRELLGEYGYEAVIAASVSDALESARSGGLALCILDHWITEGNGIELCQQIRAFDADTPIMFYSGAAYETDIRKGLAAGAQAYLIKPDFESLRPTIDRLIDEAGSRSPVAI